MQDMVSDNLLTNQEAFVVLQHWELHIMRRKYEAAQNASQSPVPGAKNIVCCLWPTFTPGTNVLFRT